MTTAWELPWLTLLRDLCLLLNHLTAVVTFAMYDHIHTPWLCSFHAYCHNNALRVTVILVRGGARGSERLQCHTTSDLGGTWSTA